MNKNTETKIVKNNFSKSVNSYDANAMFQLYSSNELIEFVKEKIDFEPKKILEIGCGTGFLTEKILSLFPNAEITACDISEDMIFRCMEKMENISEDANIKYLVCDAQKDLPNEEFDLIISGLTIQWFNLKLFLGQLKNSPRIIFSTLTNKTFQNLRGLFDNNRIEFTGPKLLSYEKLNSICEEFATEIELKKIIYNEEYKNIIQMLKNIQLTGTGNATGKILSTSLLRNIIKKAGRGEFKDIYELVIVDCKIKE